MRFQSATIMRFQLTTKSASIGNAAVAQLETPPATTELSLSNSILTLVYSGLLWSTLIDGEVEVANADRSAREPALARVTIFEAAERPWGWLSTSAEVDDRVYVGSREWRQQQCNAGSS